MWLLKICNLNQFREFCTWNMHAKSRKSHFFLPKCNTNKTDRRTDGRTDRIHTSFSLTQPISREHNSPSGKKRLAKSFKKTLNGNKLHVICICECPEGYSCDTPNSLILTREWGDASINRKKSPADDAERRQHLNSVCWAGSVSLPLNLSVLQRVSIC